MRHRRGVSTFPVRRATGDLYPWLDVTGSNPGAMPAGASGA
jgi:hypothetical protein